MIALHPLLSCHHGIVLSCHHVKFIIKLHSTIVLSCFPSDLIIFASLPLLNIKEWERKGEERESLSESALQCHSESICTSLLLLVQLLLHFATHNHICGIFGRILSNAANICHFLHRIFVCKYLRYFCTVQILPQIFPVFFAERKKYHN